jgi:hypothetical protein
MAKKTKDAVKRQASAKNGKTKTTKVEKPDCELPEAVARLKDRALKLAGKKPAGAQYQATGKLTSSLVKEMGVQPQAIAAAIVGSKQPLTNEQIQTLIKGKVKSVQPLSRVVSFYLTKWKHDGLVARV